MGLYSTNRVPLRSVPTHSNSCQLIHSCFSSLNFHAFLFGNSRFTFKKWIKLIWKGKHINQSKQLPFELCVGFLPYPVCLRLVATSPHLPSLLHPFSFCPHPKIHSSHWLVLPMSCLHPWIFDTCWRSKRGLFSFSSYLRDLSLPYSLPFIIALICY